jgi:hypothetical protein
MTRLDIIKHLAEGPKPAKFGPEASLGGWTPKIYGPRGRIVGGGAVTGTVEGGGDRQIKRNLKVDESGVPTDSEQNSAYYLLMKDRVKKAQGFATDWVFIWRMVREARCTMILQGDTLRLRPLNVLFGGKPEREFRLFDFPRGQVGPVNGVFPILAVSSPITAVYAPGSMRGIVTRDITSKSRNILSRSIGDILAKTSRSSEGAVQLPEDENFPGAAETGDGGSFWPGNPERADVTAAAIAEYDAMSEGMGIPLEITTLLDPQFFPGDAGAVRGISVRHDKNYAALKVRYTIGLDGASMVVSMISNVKYAAGVLSTAEKPLGEIADPSYDSSQNAANRTDAPPPKVNG